MEIKVSMQVMGIKVSMQVMGIKVSMQVMGMFHGYVNESLNASHGYVSWLWVLKSQCKSWVCFMVV